MWHYNSLVICISYIMHSYSYWWCRINSAFMMMNNTVTSCMLHHITHSNHDDAQYHDIPLLHRVTYPFTMHLDSSYKIDTRIYFNSSFSQKCLFSKNSIVQMSWCNYCTISGSWDILPVSIKGNYGKTIKCAFFKREYFWQILTGFILYHFS